MDTQTPRESRTTCETCTLGHTELPILVKALMELQMELNMVSADENAMIDCEVSAKHYYSSRGMPNATYAYDRIQRAASEVTKQGLGYGVKWSATELRRLLGYIQGTGHATVHPRYLPPPDSRVSAGTTRQEQIRLATQTYGSQYNSNITDRPSLDSHSRRPSISQDRLPYSHESLPPIIPPDEMKRSRNYEQPPTASTVSPYPSSGSSIYAPSHSPIQSHGLGRSLPSPPGMNAPSTSLPSPGPVAASAHTGAHTAHLQDLQHQISTKTLALQTLQREHDQLLAAFSRSQIRCSTLDKKSQVSDHEINNLSEEKVRLQQQVETLESSIEELTKARDDAQKQSSADGMQWRQILNMSSQLQKRSAEEAQEHKVAKDEWSRERERLEQHIRLLESGRSINDATNDPRYREIERTSDDAGEDPLASASLTVLRNEIRRLQRRCMELEAVLNDVTGETEQLGQAMKAMANIRARISGKSKEEEDTT